MTAGARGDTDESALRWAVRNPRALFDVVVSGLAWMLQHPFSLIKLASALRRGDDASLVRQIGPDLRSTLGLRLMLEGSVQEVSFLRDGTRWRTDLGDDIGRSLWAHGSYEGDAIAAVARWLAREGRADGWVIDVGANIGTTSLPFARAGYRVLAVEPVPHTFAMLTTNVVENGLGDRIVPVDQAVSLTAGTVDMWTGCGSGQAEVAVDGKLPASTRFGAQGELTTVRSAPLAEVIAASAIELDDVALVWSDVQGSETDVVLSAAAAWRAGVPLYLEVDPSSLELHGGLGTFTDAVVASFSSYLSREDLVRGAAPRPIASFAGWVASIDPMPYSDALLIP